MRTAVIAKKMQHTSLVNVSHLCLLDTFSRNYAKEVTKICDKIGIFLFT